MIIVERDKLSYGYVEAVHFWYEMLMNTFKNHQCFVSGKDKCVFIKHELRKLLFCGTTVDDCLFICVRNKKWQIQMFKDTFEEVTIEAGDELGQI
jgi:hypothetical protein